MKNWKKLVGIALVLVMVCGLLAACGGSSSDNKTDGNAQPESKAAGESQAAAPAGSGLTIGYNVFGQGAYSITTLANNQKFVIEAFGNTPKEISDDFQVDKIIQDIENLVSSGCDGIIIWLPVDAMYPAVMDICDKAGVPYVFADKVPIDPEVKAQALADPLFAGAVGPANAEYGKIIADYALGKGYKSCIILTGSQGDPTDTPRIDTFTETFTKGGGEVKGGVVYCDSFDIIQQNAENALVANPDVDFVYGTGSDYGVAAAKAIQNLGLKTTVLTSGLDSAVMELLNDGGVVEFVNGDFWISGTMAAVALQNYLDGNKLVDADGNTVWVEDIMPFEVSAVDYATFLEVFVENSAYAAEEIRAMSPISYDEFIGIINNYSLDERAQAQGK